MKKTIVSVKPRDLMLPFGILLMTIVFQYEHPGFPMLIAMIVCAMSLFVLGVNTRERHTFVNFLVLAIVFATQSILVWTVQHSALGLTGFAIAAVLNGIAAFVEYRKQLNDMPPPATTEFYEP
ncbi:MAG: hypothetical protein ABSG25_01905 [Bryobacteraceae bacterium]|jgi:hypothetical protein